MQSNSPLRQRLRHWFEATALRDPVERGQATAFQIILLLTIGLGLFLSVMTSIGWLSGAPTSQALLFLGLALLLGFGSFSALVMLRRGYFEPAVLLTTVGLTLMNSTVVVLSNLAVPDLLLMYIPPLTLAGLLSSRRALPLVSLIAISAVWFAALSAPPQPMPMPSLNVPSPPIFIAFNFTLIFGLSSSFFVVFGNALHSALGLALTHEQELVALRNTLEQTVTTRTAALERAIAEVEFRASEEARLRAVAEDQRVVLREMAVPVLPITNSTLVIPLVGALDSQRIADLQHQALTTVERTKARVLVLDITGVPIVDTQVAAGIIMVMRAVQLLGARAVLVGMRPEVAQALVGLGVDLHDIPTYSTLQAALRIR